MIAQRGWVVKLKRRYGEGSAGRLTQGQRWRGLFPRPSSPVLRHCEANARIGCGNPLPRPNSRPSSFVSRPPSLRSPEGAVAIRIPRPNPRLSSPVPRKPRGISRGPQPPGRWGRIPRPYSPEYGAAPFGRCWKIPAKRPSQIETICFDLKRRNHRAIRSFRSITVLRKRSERRVFRRGSPGAPLPSFAALRKKVAPAGAKCPSSYPRPRRSGQSSVPRHCEAGARTGCGNPLSPSRRSHLIC